MHVLVINPQCMSSDGYCAYCVCVCVCVREREREREKLNSHKIRVALSMVHQARALKNSHTPHKSVKELASCSCE